jgi:hypothetical protein
MAKHKSNGSSIFDQFKNVSQQIDAISLTPAEIASLHEAGIDPSKLKLASRGGRPFKFSIEQELLICTLIEKGFSITTVAEQFKVDPQTIRNIIKRHVGMLSE